MKTRGKSFLPVSCVGTGPKEFRPFSFFCFLACISKDWILSGAARTQNGTNMVALQGSATAPAPVGKFYGTRVDAGFS